MSSIKRFAALVLSILAVLACAAQATAEPRDKDKDPTEVAKVTAGRPIPGAPDLPLVPDDGTDRPTGAGVAAQAVSLPFNFSYDFSSTLASRTFWPTSGGKVCVSLRGTGSTDPTYFAKEIRVEIWNAFGTDTRVGVPVRYSLNGSYYGYCWTGLYPYHEHFFKLTKDWGPGARVWGNGWASAS
ncbi:hypothetical protein [Actinokineospora sp. NBRC 105648]|uniref:hypothetical protein n=1 Tax=Actinokineospora sp. NBRC 105648 TaxID=3032206 RepID=UPI0024A550E5|nr:hypothetical protein [Actinokineospora sp. NBRC 105648]GLZ40008.1 hypothetical protein Acsp05_36320 [Actinokineospora sp. NBRC 105648]